ncbi:hypothetical protein [Chryseobacterium sp.]|uniref:hypothetical protein n=1 Tax=Chryseobacterium sp. TaxID=1871047 RepID=UPI0028A171AA|nr:hypothetical protein [Chryseobacterium sp.]
MTQRKKLNLKELELQLPAIETNETKIILGGNDYEDGIFHLINEEGDTIVHIIDNCVDGNPGGGNNVGGSQEGNNAGADDDQGDFDHYYDYDYDDGYADGNVDYSQGPPTTSPFHTPTGLSNGMNLAQPNINMDPLIDDGVQDATIMAQVQGILSSNSVIKGLLGFYNNGYFNLTIGSETIPNANGQSTGAITGFDSTSNWTTVYIALNELGFNENGWQWDWTGLDNMGFDHSSLNTIEELVAILAHESIHAKHNADFLNALHENGMNMSDTRNWMISQGYSTEYINAWFSVDANGNVGFNPNHGDAVHTYMQNHDQDIIQHAIDEFRTDMHQLQQTVDNLRQEADFAYKESLSSNPMGESDQSDWAEYYQTLQHQLNELLYDWGAFIDKGF